MSIELQRVLSRIADLPLLIIGDVLLDEYIDGAATRISREAPVPILEVVRHNQAPGGAANAALNAAALGAAAAIISVTGDDHAGLRLRETLAAGHVDVSGLLLSSVRKTLEKTRISSGGQTLLRCDRQSLQTLDEDDQEELLEVIERRFPEAGAVIISDYGYGVLAPAVIGRVAQLQRTFRKPLILDSHTRLPEFGEIEPKIIKPNYSEAAALLGLSDDLTGEGRIQAVVQHSQQLLQCCRADLAIVTLDRDGAVLLSPGSAPYRTYGRLAHPARAVGAGDTFTASFAAALAAECNARQAAELAAAAASVVVTKQGTTPCSAAELRAALESVSKLVLDEERFLVELDQLRREGKRVVFANGCFDLLHAGHVDFLSSARTRGDLLIVAVNGDKSIRRLKGAGRPINALQDRLKVLNELACIDYLVTFDADTACELVQRIRPEVFVKSSASRESYLPEAPLVAAYGGRVEHIEALHRQSTNGTIRRIRSAGTRRCCSGSNGDWRGVRRLLCMRLDTVGDVLMCEPAMRALKESFHAELTLLTSKRGAAAAPLLATVDQTLVAEVPWMKTAVAEPAEAEDLAARLSGLGMDAAVIFTSYSQSPLPAALSCWTAGIPLTLAHCRENPYQLLSHWVAEHEPDKTVRHEVQRQLDLVQTVGARTDERRIRIRVDESAEESLRLRLRQLGITDSYIVVHAGASAASRRYPVELYAAALREVGGNSALPLIFTGSAEEVRIIEAVREGLGAPSTSLTGQLTLSELAALIRGAALLISNNTAPVHIAAAVGTPVVDIYALTNPQHTPWLVEHRLVTNDVPCKYCYKSSCPQLHHSCMRGIHPTAISRAALELLGSASGAGSALRAS